MLIVYQKRRKNGSLVFACIDKALTPVIKRRRAMLKETLFLHAVTDKDVNEVAKTWSSDHSPLSEDEARGVIAVFRFYAEK